MTNRNKKVDCSVVVPLVVAHQFCRLFELNPDTDLLLLAADAVNKTKPTDGLLERVKTKEPTQPDSLFLLANLDCLSAVPKSQWPKRQLNKAKWGVFTEIMTGLDLYLEPPVSQPVQAKEALPKPIIALFDFITFDIDGIFSTEVQQALASESSAYGFTRKVGALWR
jgi:hypothetical protein